MQMKSMVLMASTSISTNANSGSPPSVLPNHRDLALERALAVDSVMSMPSLFSAALILPHVLTIRWPSSFPLALFTRLKAWWLALPDLASIPLRVDLVLALLEGEDQIERDRPVGRKK